MIATDWGDRIALDPIVMPEATPDWVAHVMERGLAHASECGLEAVGLEVDRADAVLRELLIGHGFTTGKGGVVETWLAAEARPAISPLHDGYRLSSRLDTMPRPHHMLNAKRNHPDVEARLRQTSLYRPDLDLVVSDSRDGVASYGLFWYDPVTHGSRRPRTEDDHQRRGLAPHPATGVDLLTRAGNHQIGHSRTTRRRGVSTSASAEPFRQTVVFSFSRAEEPRRRSGAHHIRMRHGRLALIGAVALAMAVGSSAPLSCGSGLVLVWGGARAWPGCRVRKCWHVVRVDHRFGAGGRRPRCIAAPASGPRGCAEARCGSGPARRGGLLRRARDGVVLGVLGVLLGELVRTRTRRRWRLPSPGEGFGLLLGSVSIGGHGGGMGAMGCRG